MSNLSSDQQVLTPRCHPHPVVHAQLLMRSTQLSSLCFIPSPCSRLSFLPTHTSSLPYKLCRARLVNRHPPHPHLSLSPPPIASICILLLRLACFPFTCPCPCPPSRTLLRRARVFHDLSCHPHLALVFSIHSPLFLSPPVAPFSPAAPVRVALVHLMLIFLHRDSSSPSLTLLTHTRFSPSPLSCTPTARPHSFLALGHAYIRCHHCHLPLLYLTTSH